MIWGNITFEQMYLRIVLRYFLLLLIISELVHVTETHGVAELSVLSIVRGIFWSLLTTAVS